jgi:hypothetical protein
MESNRRSFSSEGLKPAFLHTLDLELLRRRKFQRFGKNPDVYGGNPPQGGVYCVKYGNQFTDLANIQKLIKDTEIHSKPI